MKIGVVFQANNQSKSIYCSLEESHVLMIYLLAAVLTDLCWSVGTVISYGVISCGVESTNVQ